MALCLSLIHIFGIFACGGCALGVYSIGEAAIAAQIASGGTAYGEMCIRDRI